MTEQQLRDKLAQLNVTPETILRIQYQENDETKISLGKIEFYHVNGQPAIRDDVVGARLQAGEGMEVFMPIAGGMRLSNLIDISV